MIEFTQDGPFSEKADQLFPDRVRILGLGQTGAAVCDQMVLHSRGSQDLWVFDSDQQTIEASIVTNRHLLGADLVHGLGCNGDLDLAREIVALEENRLAGVAHGCDFLVLILGLGGAMGVALAEHLISLGRKAETKVIVLGVLPFAFEGWARREKSIQALAELRKEADSVLVLSHDRLAENPTAIKNVRHGFHLMHQLLAQTTQALTQVVCKRGLVQLSFADVRSLYGRYTGAEVLENCWVAHAEGDIHDGTEEMVQRLLSSPLLSDAAIWKHIDHAIVTVNGTRYLGLSDVQEMVATLKERLPVKIPVAISASLDDDNSDKVRMTVLLAMTAPMLVDSVELPGPGKNAPKAPTLAQTAPLPPPSKAKAASPAAAPSKNKAPRPQATPRPEKPAPVVAPEEPDFEEEILPPLDELTAVEKPSVPTPKRFFAKQEEMQFEGPTRGRFEKTHETIYRGENLDQPTFRRRGLKIRL